MLGAVAGGLAYLLVALFLGAVAGVLVALAAIALTRQRRDRAVSIAFAMATLFSALAISLPVIVQLAATVFFGAGLFLHAGRAPHAAES